MTTTLVAILASSLSASPVGYRLEIPITAPFQVHVIRWDPKSATSRAVPSFTGPEILSMRSDFARSPLSQVVSSKGAYAGINGDFFDHSADPSGAMIVDGTILSRPTRGRPSVGWGAGRTEVAKLLWHCWVKNSEGKNYAIAGLNEECPPSAMTLFTEESGLAIARPPCRYWVIRPRDRWAGTTTTRLGVIEQQIENKPFISVPAGCLVIAQRSPYYFSPNGLTIGRTVTICQKTEGMKFPSIRQVIGGGPYLVKNSKVLLDWRESQIKSYIVNERYSRTAIGVTGTGDMLFCVIESKAGNPVGVTLETAARAMLQLGCIEAINLDGGGASTMSILGKILNRPTDGRERSIANCVLFFKK